MKQKQINAGFLPLSLKLYEDFDPGYYKNYEPFIKDIEKLIGNSDIKTVSSGVVFDIDHVKEAEKLFIQQDISFIILIHLCYSPSFLIADFIEKLNVPVLIIDSTTTQSFDNMGSEYMMQNHGIHGVMDLTSVLKSREVNYTVVAGHRDDMLFQKRLEEALSAFSAATLYKNQNIGITGKPFAGMGDFSIDFEILNNQFGIEVKEISIDDLIKESKKISDSEIDSCISEDKKIWDTSMVPKKVYIDSVRNYLALKQIVEQKEITGYTMNFQHITEDIPTPFYGCSKLMSTGYGYGGEGDVLTASLGYPLNYLSSAAKFDEFFCADWKNNLILMSHMGESDSRFIKNGSSPQFSTRDGLVNSRESIIYRFQAEPGEVTFVNLSPSKEGNFRMVAGMLDIIDTPVLDKIESPHYQVKTQIPVNEFLENYAYAGGGHHLYIAKGNILKKLGIFCRILGFEFIII